MPISFPNIDALEAYVDANITANGMELITGPINNNALNGCIEFIRQSPLNWAKAAVYNNTSGAINAPVAIVVFSGSTSPDSLSWADNIYNEYVFINMTPNAIPIITPSFYYNLVGQAIDNIPANTSINVFKAANDLWVQGNNTGSGGGGSTQKQPQTYIVGTTSGAPVAETNTWQLPAFLNSWIVLILSRSVIVDMTNAGDGSAFITKTLSSDTLTITNYQWNSGDVLSYILITP